MRTRKKRARGFTLIEVLMVIVIIGLLAGVAVVSYRSTRKGAEIKTTRALLEEVGTALEMFYTDVQRYPTEDQGLAALRTKPDFEDEATGRKWNGPYLKKSPKDAWGNDLVYAPVEDAGQVGEDGVPVKPYNLYSKGPDGQEDTDDDVKLEEDEEEQV
jgi:general secretion pathway protein G